MPILDVVLSGVPSAERSAAVAAALTALTADILRKDARLTSVAIRYAAPEHWVVGGAPLAAQNRTSFFVDVRVTAGTNTRDEKARYIAAIFDRMGKLLGALHEASYVHVHSVPAEDWGYGGRSQAQRRAAATPIAA
ncbi:MAG: tautomerase family protein [Burkholderiales bacterium]